MEQPIKNIVVGFDFSEQATGALQTAMGLAAKNKATVHVLTSLPGHINPEVMKAARTGATANRDQLFVKQAMMENLEGRVQGIVDKMKPEGVKVSCEVSADTPLNALEDLSKLHSADLIVVGNTGLDALGRLFLGSTSQKLVHKSRFPVLIAKAGQPWPPQEILCPIDFSDASRRALGWAAELASMTQARVHVLYVQEQIPTAYMEIYGVNYVPAESELLSQRAEAMERITTFCDIPDLKDVTWDVHLSEGRVDEVICKLVDEVQADLVCMGSVGRTGLGQALLGNTAERIMRRLPCSLLTVKPDDFVLHH